MTDSLNVLLTAAGRRVSLLACFRESVAALGLKGRVMAADQSRLSSATHSADRGFRVPPCSSDEYVPALLDICTEQGVRLLVPTIDPELPVLAEHRDKFATIGAVVAVSGPETVTIATDKAHTHRWLEQHDFPTVRQTTGTGALDDGRAWPLPLVVKPRCGSASEGVVTVRTRDELAHAARDTEMVVQTVAPGVEHTVDVLVDRERQAVCAVPRRRLEVRGGEVTKAVTVRCPAVEELARKLCAALPDPYGPITVQVFLDEPTGGIEVIEINPRFAGGFPLAWRAGADYPRWLLEEIAGLPSTAAPDRWRTGLVMLRYDDAVFVDASAVGL